MASQPGPPPAAAGAPSTLTVEMASFRTGSANQQSASVSVEKTPNTIKLPRGMVER